jgi:hypothetical protein
MKLILMVSLLILTHAVGAQTNRHGQSNGTVKELPEPRIFHDPQPLTETSESTFSPTGDPEIARIESEYQAQLDKIAAQLDRSLPVEYKRLSAQTHRIKLDREIAILEYLRSRAEARDDLTAIEKIEFAIETLTARKSDSQQRAEKATARGASTQKTTKVKMNGNLPEAEQSGGAR